jgi:phosphoribosylformimino-5-aminoimidazole carboxamide ribotide isomerase
MEVIPAIDIRGGRCVRLHQGDYALETVFDADPVAVARSWAAEGATRIHVVDLDGARDGAQANAGLVRAIASAVSCPVQTGGGIRDLETLRATSRAACSAWCSGRPRSRSLRSCARRSHSRGSG